MATTKRKKQIIDNIEDDTDFTEDTFSEDRQPVSTQKNPNYILIILLMAVSFFSGYLLMKTTSLQKSLVEAKAQQAQPAAQQQAAPTTVSVDKVKPLFADGFIHFGNNKNKVLIVEITDPSCPYCHIAGGLNPELSKTANFQYVSDGGQYTPPVPEIRKLVDEGKASLAVLFSTGHGAGRLGMEALYCAFEKGDFWPVHDKLMSNAGYDLLNNTVKNDRAQSQKLVDFLAESIDSSFLKTCLESSKYESKLVRDEQEIAPGLGFQGTPHFIINDKIVNGAHDYKDIKAIIDPLL